LKDIRKDLIEIATRLHDACRYGKELECRQALDAANRWFNETEAESGEVGFWLGVLSAESFHCRYGNIRDSIIAEKERWKSAYRMIQKRQPC